MDEFSRSGFHDQTKGFESDALTHTLFALPVLLTEDALRKVLAQLCEWDDFRHVRNVLLALASFMQTYPMPFWVLDVPDYWFVKSNSSPSE
jgi:hypothetical protein